MGFFIDFIIYGIIDRKSVYRRADYCFIGVIGLSAAGGYVLRLWFYISTYAVLFVPLKRRRRTDTMRTETER